MAAETESVTARPIPALRPYVDWYSGYRETGGLPSVHRGLPSPQLTLIFTLTELLLSRLDTRAEFQPEVQHVWRTLLASGGTAEVAGLAKSVGWSTRHLSGRFHREFGVGPKAFGRLVRFRRTASQLPRAVAAGHHLAEIAAAHGYYDQAHLAAEFRALAGCPPTAWLAAEFRNFQAREQS